MVEGAPDTENVVYIDEYPHLAEKVRLQRLGRPAVNVVSLRNVLVFEQKGEDDGTELLPSS